VLGRRRGGGIYKGATKRNTYDYIQKEGDGELNLRA